MNCHNSLENLSKSQITEPEQESGLKDFETAKKHALALKTEGKINLNYVEANFIYTRLMRLLIEISGYFKSERYLSVLKENQRCLYDLFRHGSYQFCQGS